MNQPVTGVPQMLPTQVIDTSTDSREILKHARLAARRRNLQDWFVVDVDAHHVETVSWNEIVQYIDDPVVRDQALHFHKLGTKTQTDECVFGKDLPRLATLSVDGSQDGRYILVGVQFGTDDDIALHLLDPDGSDHAHLERAIAVRQSDLDVEDLFD